MEVIYSLAMTELFEFDLPWNLNEDLRFLEIPSHLVNKAVRPGVLDLYRLFMIMNHYISAAQARAPDNKLPPSPWLLLANYIFFLNTYSTVF